MPEHKAQTKSAEELEHQQDPAAEGNPADDEIRAVPAESPQAMLERELAQLKEQNLRLRADAENERKRLRRESEERLRYAEADFARDLLVIIDDLERTLASAEQVAGAASVADGVRIVYEHFLKVLGEKGIQPINAKGQPFDPTYHEALMQQPSDEIPAGTVIDEIARGYTMHDRVLRSSRVVVSSGPPADAGRESEPQD